MEHLSLYATYIPKMEGSQKVRAELGQQSGIHYTYMGRVQAELGAGREEKKSPWTWSDPLQCDILVW